MNKIQIIQGGQYGSEAKGAVAGHLAVSEKIDVAVRTGASNAGHTVYFEGKKFVMQQLPVGWVNPYTTLVIGAGALIDPDILRRELDDVQARAGLDLRKRLVVDPRAYIHWPWHAKESSRSDRHRLIGATGKGCSEALISRLRMRGVEDHSFGRHADRLGLNVELLDTERFLNDSYDAGAKIQLEGTQGQLLDLCLGPYPYTTHKQTGPAQWLSECGLSPALPLDIVMVIRTYPIRVAGNSGPLPQEISWPILSRRINSRRVAKGLQPIVNELAVLEFEDCVRRAVSGHEIPDNSKGDGLDQHLWSEAQRVQFSETLSNLNKDALELMSDEGLAEVKKLFEMTTVTKKLRRVAELNFDELRRSARQIRPHRVVVTFLNYDYCERWYDDGGGAMPLVSTQEQAYLSNISHVCEAPVTHVNYGPEPKHFAEMP